MNVTQIKNSSLLFAGNILIKLSNFTRQLLLAYFVGVSEYVDVLIISQLIPALILGVVGGLAGEIIVATAGKNNGINSRFVGYYSFILLIVSGILVIPYIIGIPLWMDLLDVKAQSFETYKKLSIIFALNIFPGILVSVMQPLVYLKGKYKEFIYVTLMSELTGVITILFLVGEMGIMAFAVGAVIVSVVNSISYLILVKIDLSQIFNYRGWLRERSELIKLFKQHFLLTGNGVIGYLSNIIERSFSIKYLQTGYLSSLNYSKTLFLLPNSILLSSIITTTYMEQVKRYSDGLEELSVYTQKMFRIISLLASIFQVILILFAPLILIIFFRRGKFDNSDVESTLIIFEILTLGFTSVVINDFFTRTLYIFSSFKSLLMISAINVFSQLILLSCLVKQVPQIVPITIVLGYFTGTFILFKIANKHLKQKADWALFLKRQIAVILISFGAILLNSLLLPYYLERSNFELFIFSVPLGLLVAFTILLVFKKNGFMLILTERIPFIARLLPKFFYS
jgi:putative peptidoglycan lipid II flippase